MFAIYTLTGEETWPLEGEEAGFRVRWTLDQLCHLTSCICRASNMTSLSLSFFM